MIKIEVKIVMPIVCIVDSIRDICICTEDTCLKCLEKKFRFKILRSYPISIGASKEWKKEGIRGVRVKCSKTKEHEFKE